jgi:hypothetical protein
MRASALFDGAGGLLYTLCPLQKRSLSFFLTEPRARKYENQKFHALHRRAVPADFREFSSMSSGFQFSCRGLGVTLGTPYSGIKTPPPEPGIAGIPALRSATALIMTNHVIVHGQHQHLNNTGLADGLRAYGYRA